MVNTLYFNILMYMHLKAIF